MFGPVKNLGNIFAELNMAKNAPVSAKKNWMYNLKVSVTLDHFTEKVEKS